MYQTSTSAHDRTPQISQIAPAHKHPMRKTSRIITSKRPYITVIITLTLSAIALFLLKDSIFDNKKNSDDTTPNQPRVNQSASQNSSQKAPPSATSTLAPAPPETAPHSPPETALQPTTSSCQKVADDLQFFFKQLDKQDYIKAYTEKEPLQNHLSNIITKMLDHPPVNEKETADLLTVLKNAAHFFRILGLKDLSLLRDILTNEHSSLEQHFASFYAWSTRGKDCPGNTSILIQLPVTKTYEYAAFFLNTLGGQSYLARRDPALRILTRYYSVLILNQACQQSINRYNIDLAYHLKAVIKEISDSDFLKNQSNYLDTLQKIKVRH
jgi:hypothetical protein